MQGKPTSPVEHFIFEQFGDIIFFNIDKFEVSLLSGAKKPSLSPDLRSSLEGGIHRHGELLTGFKETGLDPFQFDLVSPGKGNDFEGSWVSDSPRIHTIALNMAEDCNLRCKYCYQDNGPFGMHPGRMSQLTAQRAIDLFLDLSQETVNRIYFFGGEPLLNPMVMFFAYDYARNKFSNAGKIVHFSLVTNGTLITPEMTEKLMETDIQVIVGIDGPPHVHNVLRYGPGGTRTYEDIVPRLIPWIKARRIGAVTVLSEFETNLIKIVEHLRSIGVENFVFRLPICFTEGADEWIKGKLNVLKEDLALFTKYYLSELLRSQNGHRWRLHKGDIFYNYIELLCLKKKRNYPCDAGLHEIGISCNGDIYPCPYFAGLPEYRVGRVSHGVNWKRLGDFLEAGRLSQKGICGNCWARYLCGGGCLRDGLGATGSVSLPNIQKCEITKHIIRLSLFIYAHLQKEFPGLVGLHLNPGNLSVFHKMYKEISSFSERARDG